MADASKAERLAAARKKLQDFQRKKEILPPPIINPPPIASALEGNVPPASDQIPKFDHGVNTISNLTSSGPSSSPQLPFDGHTPLHVSEPEDVENTSVNLQTSNGYQISSSGIQEPHSNPYINVLEPSSSFNESPAVFCGNSYFSNGNNASSELFSTVSSTNNHQNYMESASFPTSQGSTAYSTAHLFSQTTDNTVKWDFNPPLNTPSPFNLSSTSDVSNLTPHSEVNEAEALLSSKEESSQEEIPLTQSNFTKEQAANEPAIILHNSGPQEQIEASIPVNGSFSAESIRQLSDQITQLIEPSEQEDERQNSSFSSALESRNQELAAQLAAERRNNQQLQFSLKESLSQVSYLQSKVEDLQSQQEVVLARHLGPLQEQLRAHAQTVGILVGEKTELEAAINHHTATAKQHAAEVEELQNRLRASRHRVSELEKELTTVTAAASASDKQKNNHVQELDQLRLQNGMLSKQLEDAEEEASELRQKLGARVSEVASLTAQLQEKQSQLSLSQLRITQLSSSDNPEATAEIESLHQLKISLERRCAELTETVRQLSADRDQADQQYQQYVAQLNGQLQSAQSKLESLNVENNRLKNREEDLVRNMSELERQLQQQIQMHHQQQQQLQHNQLQQQPLQDPGQTSDGLASLQEKIAELEEERQRLQSSLESGAEELASLRLKLEEKDAHIADLEILCSERPDQSRLLAAMESDKVAAAQATSQNTTLKQQLQELQDGFIKMSNDKLNLTESLEHEKHVNKEMGEKISQLAEELHELRVLVSEKERRLQEYREHELEHNHDEQSCNGNHNHSLNNGNNMKKGSVHIHEDSHVTSSLQEQLSQAHEHIHNLSSQNNNLRRFISQKSTESHESGSSSSATEGATTDDAAADHDTNCEDMSDSHANYNSMQYAMEKLQERFTRTMAEVAELSDEKQRLEHLVLQLQGETETIGEYVALYQMQRAALQQRAREKDHQLASLSAEREDLRRKLQELNQLIQRLLEERGTETAKEALPLLDSLKENAALKNDTNVIEVPHVAESVDHEANVHNDVAKRLSKKIMDIIEDISMTNDVETSFHPCPWCSGKLINV
ncbi:Golgin subfamily A member 2 [Frankliniella fusca]|uniref:Golgin subfamily A member 2 n=1 Tax=Frankliniella fusca TaxID=407009 RepID=A0AAE1GU01_9NEOP|nr:Golgin subfamily A member 2 [Frankliniella fusca]